MDNDNPYRPKEGEVSNEPLMDKVGNVLIVGEEDHLVHLSELDRSSERITTAIQQSQHLLLEGKINPLHAPRQRINYIAYAAMEYAKKGKAVDIHMLEDGVDFSELAEKYGLDQRSYFLRENYRIVHASSEAFLKRFPLEQLDQSQDQLLRFLLESAMESFPRMPESDARVLLQRLIGVEVDLLKSGDERTRLALTNAAYSVSSFLAPIRDYEVFVPQISAFDRSHHGEKVVIVGSDHHEPVLRALRTGTMPQPNNWQQFNEGRHPIDKAAQETFDRVFADAGTSQI